MLQTLSLVTNWLRQNEYRMTVLVQLAAGVCMIFPAYDP